MFTIKIVYANGQEYGLTTNEYRKLNLAQGVTVQTDSNQITLNQNDNAYIINESGITIGKISGKDHSYANTIRVN